MLEIAATSIRVVVPRGVAAGEIRVATLKERGDVPLYAHLRERGGHGSDAVGCAGGGSGRRPHAGRHGGGVGCDGRVGLALPGRDPGGRLHGGVCGTCRVRDHERTADGTDRHDRCNERGGGGDARGSENHDRSRSARGRRWARAWR